MSNHEPQAEAMLTTPEASVLPWAEAQQRFTNAGTTYLSTVRPDGRPHTVPVGAAWLENTPYFTTGQGTLKEKNILQNPNCSMAMSSSDFDLLVEGVAARVTDEQILTRLAAFYSTQGWPATAGDGVLDAPFSAPTTGPAPYNVYAITPSLAFALPTQEATINQATRYRF